MNAVLDMAALQKAHGVTLAIRTVVELIRQVKREHELHREILAFPISHEYRAVRIYGHYPVIEGRKVPSYRQPTGASHFTSEAGKEKWMAYEFTKNTYDLWVQAWARYSAIEMFPSDCAFEIRFPQKHPDYCMNHKKLSSALRISSEMEIFTEENVIVGWPWSMRILPLTLHLQEWKQPNGWEEGCDIGKLKLMSSLELEQCTNV